jgi:hypothetical protein
MEIRHSIRRTITIAATSFLVLLQTINTAIITIVNTIITFVTITTAIAVVVSLVNPKEPWPWEGSKRCHRACA